jgi:DNA polymerase III gamma/tau subunit
LKALAARFSREDLLRAFDLLTRAESDIRSATQPRYHLEMALLRWIHLRKLVPIEDLIAGVKSGAPLQEKPASPQAGPNRVPPPQQKAPQKAPPSEGAPGVSRTDSSGSLKDALLAEIKKSKTVFYNMVVAQAQKIEVAGDRVTFTFSAAQRTLCDTVEQHKAWLESVAQRLADRKIAVVGVLGDPASPQAGARPASPATAVSAGGAAGAADGGKKSALREQALADAGVQALLEVFPAEIRDVEEM